ncbi:MAG: 4'-phosphopantetheinyl transferase superfamily protein, partial [bacterium]|nr:4'-phosphopantetheinyl transferase superfamily protein [bacterium]
MVQISDTWQLPPDRLDLTGADVHIWAMSLARCRLGPVVFEDILSKDEFERAERFVFEKDRVRFIAARGGLRLILGRYLGRDPGQLVFEYSERGKPHLKGTPENLKFNVSHSENLALYAMVHNREVGVDVEYVGRKVGERNRIAKRFFCRAEYEVFLQVPDDQKQLAFLNCWTRKEAFIKALGEGLYYPLDAFEVTLTPGEDAQLVHIHG